MIELFLSFNEISVTVRLVLAVICGGIIGIERETKRRAAGFRTHVLIAMGSAMTSLLGQYLASIAGGLDPLRISAQVVAGMGFIGAGTIIVTRRKETKGLTTAAGLWTTAIIGLAAGAGCYIEVITSTVMILFAETVLSKIEYRLISQSKIANVYIDLAEKSEMYEINDRIAQKKIEILGTQISKNSQEDGISVLFTLKFPGKVDHAELMKEIADLEGVRRVEDI